VVQERQFIKYTLGSSLSKLLPDTTNRSHLQHLVFEFITLLQIENFVLHCILVLVSICNLSKSTHKRNCLLSNTSKTHRPLYSQTAVPEILDLNSTEQNINGNTSDECKFKAQISRNLSDWPNIPNLIHGRNNKSEWNYEPA
jgi:hypothetical protein